MYELNKTQTRAVMDINTLANICGYFFNANFEQTSGSCPNNGYNCKHPECGEESEGIGCCFTWTCPFGWEADEEDCKEGGLDYEEGRFIVTEDTVIIKQLIEKEK